MKRLTSEEFIQKAKAKHGEKYDYSLVIYKTAKIKIEIICSKHGIFQQRPDNHLWNDGCEKCGFENKRLSLDEFIKKSQKIHKLKYDYSKVDYVNNKTKVIIICPKHGEFKQHPDQHINTGTGCPKCTHENSVGGYSAEFFKINSHMNNNICLLYLVKIERDDFSCYKIGITTKTINKRFAPVRKNYLISPVIDLKTTLINAFTLEQKIIWEFFDYRILPPMKFKGWTECFVFSAEEIKTLKNKYFT